MGPENQLCPSLKATAWVERKQESEVDEGTSIYHLLCPFFLSTDGSGSHEIFSSPKTPALQGTWTDGLSALSKCRGITGADHWITRSEATNVGLVFVPVLLSGEIMLLYSFSAYGDLQKSGTPESSKSVEHFSMKTQCFWNPPMT